MADTRQQSKGGTMHITDERSSLTSRRTVLSVAVSATAVAAVGGVFAATPPNDVPVSVDFDLDDFIAVSGILTGIDPRKLAPRVDSLRVGRDYFSFALKKQEEVFTRFVRLYQANKTKPADTLGPLLVDQSGDEMRYMARSIILMWYLGTWYEPALLKQLATTAKPQDLAVKFQVVSPKAYSQGYVWRIAQTHPMGYSQGQFGYWHENPPPIETFVNP
jgi:Membrane bound FAD containing D-sorbitol dehydrogenase